MNAMYNDLCKNICRLIHIPFYFWYNFVGTSKTGLYSSPMLTILGMVHPNLKLPLHKPSVRNNHVTQTGIRKCLPKNVVFVTFVRYHKNGQSLLVLLPSEEPEMLKVTSSTFKYYRKNMFLARINIFTVMLRKSVFLVL